MTRLFKHAVGKASLLPEEAQDALARLVLEEIESDQRWNSLIAASPDALAAMADEAWAAHEVGGSQ